MKLFTAEEEKHLLEILSNLPDDAPVAYLEELHGLLFGLAITPETIPTEEWLPLILCEEDDREDDAESEIMAKHLVAAYDRMCRNHLKGKLVFPFDYDRMKEDDFEMVEDWTYGLFMAISFRPDIWALNNEVIDQEAFKKLPEEIQKVLDAFSAIVAIAVPDEMEAAFQSIKEEEGIGKDELLGKLLGELPLSVETLIKHSTRIRKEKNGPQTPPARKSTKKRKTVRRNLCPCGSGREYKKCCGAN